MRKAKLLLLTLLTLLGFSPLRAETVSPYLVDFNTAIPVSQHDFAVASNWGHIVPVSDYDGYGPYYMSYTYSSTDGIDGSGTLLPNHQYAGDNFDGEVVSDVLTTPVLSGTVQVYVKASSMASSSKPAFIEFYSLNSEATATSALIQRFTADDFTESAIEGWSTVSITLATPQRVGIRAQYVYLDNLTATSAEIEAQKKLLVTNVKSPTGSTPYYVNQKADGSADIELVVTLKNDGDVDFVAGTTENYTLTPVKKAYYGSGETVYSDVKFSIPTNIAAGEEATVNMTATIPDMATGWLYWKVKENISGTTSSAQVQSQVQEYASKFIFDVSGTEYYSSSSATNKAINLGKITEATTVNYEIYNPGSAPLVINSFSVPAGYTTDAPTGEFTVAAGEKKQVAITLSADSYGIFPGEIAIAYTNYGKEQANYTLAISGTVVDPSKNLITFDNGKTGTELNGQFPTGSLHSDQVYITAKTEGDVTNYCLQSTSTTTKFVTQLLTAQAGEAFTYDAWYSSYSSSASVTVYTSTDRQNWTQVDKQTATTLNSTVGTFTVTIAEAGNYYLAFELTGNALLDNIYGLTAPASPVHDWYITGSSIPAKGKQNAAYEASISLKNIDATDDEVITATLFVDGEAVATLNNVELPGNAKTTAEGTGRNDYSNIEDPTVISLSFIPHKVGTLPVSIELKSGQTTVSSDTISVAFAEEKLESDIAVGESKSTSANVPFYSTWMDESTGNAMSDFAYTPEQLAAFGIKSGDKITAITFRGTPTGTKTINQLTAEAWVAMQPAGSFEAGTVDKDNMTHAVIFDAQQVDLVSGETVDFVIDLTASPIVYDGTSAIRIYTNIDGHKQYQNINFPVDNGYSTAYYARGTSPSWSSTYVPVGYFGLAVEPTFYAGTVTDGTNPVAGAVVTLTSTDGSDTQYTGTTDAEGKFQIAIIQDKKTYDVTVTADSYADATAEGVAFPAEAAAFVLIQPYVVDFNTEILTSNHAFKVASNWSHIVDKYVDSWNDEYYMSYSYQAATGIDDSGALSVSRQRAGENYGTNNKVTYDLLVTPLVQGDITVYAKPGTLASTSNPAFVEFYTLNADGTERGELIQRFQDELVTKTWTPVTIHVDAEQKIGIRAQYVLLDNFSATKATIVPTPELTIVSVKNLNNTSSNVTFDQKEDGSYTIEYNVVIRNTGDVDLVAGETENYTLSIFDAADTLQTKYGAFAIPFNLPVGATSETFTMSIDIAASDSLLGWKYRNVVENISGNTYKAPYSVVAVYAPEYYFCAEGKTTNYTGDIAFGKIAADSTQTFDIYNAGTAPLVVKSLSLNGAPFTLSQTEGFTLAKKESKSISITMAAGTPGIFVDTLRVVYTDANGADATYTKTITGTVLDPSKTIITFDDGEGNKAYPAGSVRYATYISSSADDNFYLQGSGSGNHLFVLPLVTAQAGDNITVDAQYTSYSSSYVYIMASTDRQNWDTLQVVDDIASSYRWTTYTATFKQSGAQYLGFYVNNAKIDNIYGLTFAERPEHDWLIVNSSLPASATQNKTYSASAQLGNVGPNAEEEDSYTATLYVNGEAVDTAKAVALAVADISGNYNNSEEQNRTTFQFSFKPHITGSVPAYIEFSNGTYAVKTNEVTLNIAEEKADSELALENTGFSTSIGVVTPYYGNSESVSLYTADVLQNQYGLQAGQKISYISYKGYGTAEHQTTLDLWYEWTDDTEQAKPENGLYTNTDGMVHAIAEEVHTWPAVPAATRDNQTDVITLNFAEPITYEAGKALRIVARHTASNYKQIYMEYANGISNLSYLHAHDTYTTFETNSWSANSLPALHIGLVTEPILLTGVVTGDAAPVANAEVLIVSADEDDIQYAATTDEDGKYSINVIQHGRDYNVTVTADGFEEATAAVSFGGESKTQDFALTALSFTQKYIVNPGFELSPASSGNIGTGKTSEGVDYTESGWTFLRDNAAETWSVSAVMAYGTDSQINGAAIPAADNEGNTGNALGVSVGWGHQFYYQSAKAVTLPAGYYTLKAAAYNAGTAEQFQSLLGFVPTTGEAFVSATKSFALNQWTTDEVTFSLEQDTEGKFQVGGAAISGGSGANGKVFFDNLTLEFKTLTEGAKEAYEKALADAKEALNDAIVTGEERTTLSGVITANENVEETVEALTAATKALTESTAAFNEAKQSYETLAAAKEAVSLDAFPYAAAEKKTALETATQAEPTSAADAAAKTAALTQAYRQYQESSALLENVENATIRTTAIANPDAENNLEGWTQTLGEGSGGSLGIRSDEPFTDGEGSADHKYFDGGNWGANAWDITLSQTVTLPKGKYLLSVTSRASVDMSSFALFAGENKAEMKHIGASVGTGDFDRGWNEASVEFELTEQAAVAIGVQGVTSSQYQWMSFSRFRLAQFPDADLIAAKQALQEAIATAEATATEGKTEESIAALNDAISAAKTALDELLATTESLGAAKTAIETAIAGLTGPQLAYTVNEVANGTVVRTTTGKVEEGQQAVVPYRQYNVQEGKLYKKAASGGNKKQEFNYYFTPATDGEVVNLEDYTATGTENIVFLTEGEDIEGMTVIDSGNASIRSSNSKAGYAAEADVAFVTLKAGSYKLTAGLYDSAKTPDSDWSFLAGTDTIATLHCNKVNLQEVTSDMFTLEQETTLYVAKGGASTRGIDYIYVQEVEAVATILAYTVNEVVGGTVVRTTTGQAEKASTVTVPYRQWNVLDGKLYERLATDKQFNYPFILNSDEQTENLNYTATDVENVVFLTEVEDVEGITVIDSGNATIRSSNSKAGYAAEGNVALVKLPAGKYQITAILYDSAKTPDSDFSFIAGEETVATLHCATTNIDKQTSEEFTLNAAETTLYLAQGGSATSGVDALYIVKTGDAEVVGISSLRAAVKAGMVYNLQGQKVNDTENLKKGLYIVNGKKVVLK